MRLTPLWRKVGIRLIAAALLLHLTLFWLVPLFLPLPAGLEQPPERGLMFVDRNGEPLRRLITEEGLRIDSFASLPEIPESLVKATLVAEDKRFFSHRGIDWLALGRAALSGLSKGKVVSGASTISQQLIKLAHPPRKRHLGTKLNEVLIARRLEFKHDKATILAAYLNRLPYGNQVTGCRAAARCYFGKPLDALSLAEAAFLAGLPNRPGRLNPYRNFSGAKQRQLWILGRMLEEQLISHEAHRIASEETLNLKPEDAVFHAPHFVDLLIRQAPEVRGSAERSLVTTLDLNLQKKIEAASSQVVLEYHRNQTADHDVQAAVVVIENKTGEVLSLAGSRSFFGSRGGQINGAWTARSAGSTLKPFTYLIALKTGYTAASILPDCPVEYVSPAGAFQPVNFDRQFNGPVTLRHALANSLNVPAVRVLNDIGGPQILHRLLKEDLGFSSLNINGAEYGLGLTIGNAEVRLLELTNAYACLARLGKFLPYRFQPATTQQGAIAHPTLFDAVDCWIIADILADDAARSPAFGFYSPLNLPFPVAVKTGTSTDYRDNWTIGFTPEFTVGVWMGRFDNRPLPGKLTGGNGAARIFREVMLHLHANQAPRWYDPPVGIVKSSIDLYSGKRLDAELSRKLGSSRTRTEWFRQGDLPPLASEQDYDESGKTFLPVEYLSWCKTNDNRLHNVIAIHRSLNPEFRIVSPMNETKAYLDPDLPGGGKKFPLKIEGTGLEEISWSCDSLQVVHEKGRSWILLQPGFHIVEALDRNSGLKRASRITVQEL